ncbi:protein-ADP-ribose hydrolase [Macrococcus epidermidis]|uniref:protein-ADP-ribose hydrolase n=1 Tax=Macrococcus epidermidis TaxID=1902580 RepID=UPI0020B7841E|nr:protein-ADP-ribose hydrolase [Macrococcus epidermidis]UTH15085.1 protein-ADP-ribose hydrolase [Macrococcus epidermidis]
MNDYNLQDQRLNYLLKIFAAESDHYQNIIIPDNKNEKERILRSLMNIRLPKKISDEVIKIQDEYLSSYANEKGIVKLKDIPIHKNIFSIWQGDITRLEVDAIVNAANAQMLGCFVPMHTCIDNQIHTFAGVQLREECNNKMEELKEKYGHHYEQPTALPMMTDAYNLPAKRIVHVVGPIVSDKLTRSLEKDLADCYFNILDICLENNLKSVAFCCISTGVFRFPNKRAAQIAIDTVNKWLAQHPGAMERIIFNVFKDEDKAYYEELL